MYLLSDQSLFTDDSLAWYFERRALDGHYEYCWHDWPVQLASQAKLRTQTFSRVLAGPQRKRLDASRAHESRTRSDVGGRLTAV